MTLANETKYEEKKISVKGNVWSVLFASGKINYVQILKLTNNPFGTTGKRFDNLDQAIDNYKQVAMKAALMQLIAIGV